MTDATVLLVDDEDLVRWSLTARLGKEGVSVLDATSPERAMTWMNESVDVVVLGMRLADEQSLTVLRRVRSAVPDTPVIVMTPEARSDAAARARRLGVFAIVAKPFDLDDMAMEVGKALETSRLRREVMALRAGQHAAVLPPSGLVLEDLERALLAQALERCAWNQTHAGRLLGINRDQVRYRIEKFGIERPPSRSALLQPTPSEALPVEQSGGGVPIAL